MKRNRKIVFCCLAVAVMSAATFSFAGVQEIFVLGQRAFQARNYMRAVSYFSEVIDSPGLSKKNLAAAYGWRGMSWAGNGDNDKAVSDLDRALYTNPNDPSLWYNRGTIKKRMGDLGKAIDDFTVALKLKPSHYGALYYRGMCLNELDRMKDARADFSRAIEVDPNKPFAYFERGRLKWSAGDREGAMMDASRAVELDPGNNSYKEFKERLEKGD